MGFAEKIDVVIRSSQLLAHWLPVFDWEHRYRRYPYTLSSPLTVTNHWKVMINFLVDYA